MEKRQSMISKINSFAENSDQNPDIDDLRSNLIKAMIFNLPKKSRSRINCSTRSAMILAADNPSERALLASTAGIFYKVFETRYVYFDKSRRVSSCTTIDQPTFNFIPSSKISSQKHPWKPNLSFEFLPCFPNFSIISSCNGLLLCSSHQDSQIYVCNPLMKNWVLIPKIKDCSRGEFLVYDPKICPYHFKIFGQLRLTKSPPNQIELSVFSSIKWKWEKFELAMEGSTLPNWNRRYWASCAFYVNGTVYAINHPDILISISLNEDEAQGHFRLIKLPEFYCEPFYNRPPSVVALSNGRLCYVCNDGYVLQVWMMKEGGKIEWLLKKSVSVVDLGKRVSLPSCRRGVGERTAHDFDPLVFDSSGNVVYLRTHCMVFKYDWERDTVEEVTELCRPGEHEAKLVDISCDFRIIGYNPCGNPLKFGHKW